MPANLMQRVAKRLYARERLGSQLKDAMAAHEISQRDAAAFIGVTQPVVSFVLRDRMPNLSCYLIIKAWLARDPSRRTRRRHK